MFRSTNVPFDQCSIRPMFHSTKVPFDQCSIRPNFHSTNVPFDQSSIRPMFHSTKVSSTKVPQPVQSTMLVLSRSTMFVQAYRVLYQVWQSYICKGPVIFSSLHFLLLNFPQHYFIIITSFFQQFLYHNYLYNHALLYSLSIHVFIFHTYMSIYICILMRTKSSKRSSIVIK